MTETPLAATTTTSSSWPVRRRSWLSGVLIASVLTTAPVNQGCGLEGLQFVAELLWLAVSIAELVAVVDETRGPTEHFHGEGCGHRWRYYDGRHVFLVDTQWEYYDYDEEQWYVYPDGLPDY